MFENEKKIVADFLIRNNLTEIVESVYLVGIRDNSVLSDIDLIIISNNVKKVRKNIKQLPYGIDVRDILSGKEFLDNYPYYPYLNFVNLFGKNLFDTVDYCNNSKAKVIKLSLMFYASFLRNFYYLKRFNIKDSGVILKNLNDFEYAQFLPVWNDKDKKDFILKIQKMRLLYPKVEFSEVASLLDEAIEQSWSLIDYLDNSLKNFFSLNKNCNFFFGKEPTIFYEGAVKNCKRMNENLPAWAVRARILLLPSSFSFVLLRDAEIRKYLYYNLKTSRIGVKSFSKKVLCLYLFVCLKLKNTL